MTAEKTIFGLLRAVSFHPLAALPLAWVLCCCLVASAAARGPEPPITAIAISPDGAVVVVGSQAGIETRSWPALGPLDGIKTELTNVHDLVFSPDGSLLAAAGGAPGQFGGVEIYNWPERKLLGRTQPHDDLIYSVAWSGDSARLATASGDQRLGVFQVDRTKPPSLTLSRMLEGHSRGILAASFLPGEERLLSAGIDETVRLWDISTGATLRTLSNHTRPVVSLAVRPGAGREGPPMAASAGSDRTVRFWQPTIGRLVRFIRLESAPLAIAWSLDGKSVSSACHDGHLRQIDPETAALLGDWPAIDGPAHALAVAQDGSVLVGGENGQLVRVPVRDVLR